MKLPKRSEKLIMPNSTKIKDLLNERLLPDQREVEILLAHILQKPREFVLAHPEQKIIKTKKQKIIKIIKERSKGVPMAYLTGHKEFFGLDFLVNKNVLIPRPDTELMVEEVLKEIKTTNYRLLTIVDIGTGSGCIPISITKTLHNSSPYKGEVGGGFAVFAIDISPQALTVARKNARLNKTKIKFLQGNLLEPFSKSYKLKAKSYQLIITANLPYLTPKQIKQESSIQHEPRLALVAGLDGLKYYRKLLKQIRLLTIDYRLSTIVYLEIDPSQTSSIKSLIKKTLPQAKIEIKKDLAKKDRLVIIKI